ncbi:hypothetical protein ACIHFC_37860 [Streptomyces sp. NPDC052013]|uniref:hypothetical protein n=1 Tax=Streptomyces sp. NPDC052013 TaxID=3365679 RepID=UPI0037CCDE5A
MSVEHVDVDDLADWEALFFREVDGLPVQFVKPADTDRPTWAVYQGGAYLGTVSAERDGGSVVWRVQASCETHWRLDDVVRALRRPASWPHEREQAARWAAALLANDSLVVVDVETTGLENAHAVQIAVVDRAGDVLFNEYVRPDVVIEPFRLWWRLEHV